MTDSLHEIKNPSCDSATVAAKAIEKIQDIARQSLARRFRPTEATELIGKTFEETRWAVEGLLPEGLTVLAGPPKLGKSWLVLLVALAVASGTKSLGRFGCPRGDVLYLALEDTPRRMQSRLQKILRRTHGSAQGLFLEYACPLLGQGLESHLRGWMQEHPETRLIVIDTLAKVRPPRGRNEEPYAADYRVMTSLKAIADECRTSLVVITHTRKQADADPLAEVSGTMGLTGAADAILVLKRERGRADVRSLLGVAFANFG
ncbi:MAG: AAA family ATPase [Gemmataceae bacterium]